MIWLGNGMQSGAGFAVPRPEKLSRIPGIQEISSNKAPANIYIAIPLTKQKVIKGSMESPNHTLLEHAHAWVQTSPARYDVLARDVCCIK